MFVQDLRRVAHRATHYDQSHHDLAVVTFPRYNCDDEASVIGISYRDIAQVFGTLADLLEASDKNPEKLMTEPDRTSVATIHQAICLGLLSDPIASMTGKEMLGLASRLSCKIAERLLKERRLLPADGVGRLEWGTTNPIGEHYKCCNYPAEEGRHGQHTVVRTVIEFPDGSFFTNPWNELD